MPRPSKKRRICKEPVCSSFQPGSASPAKEIVLSMDEFAAIQMIDLEGLSQEDCAERMDVARTTAQLIYNTARRKLAEMLAYGSALRIEGGNYFVCDGSENCSRCEKSQEHLPQGNETIKK